MNIRNGIFLAFIAIFSLESTVWAAEPEVFSLEDRTKIHSRIESELAQSKKIAFTNQALDVTFKVGLLVIALGATIGAAYAATYQDTPAPRWLKITNTSLTGGAAALSAFAFTQFNFAQRQSNWEARAAALEAREFVLDFGTPDKNLFLLELGEILSWGDTKQPTSLGSLGSTKSPAKPPAEQPAKGN